MLASSSLKLLSLCFVVHGKLLCLGSVQHLKSKYLNGYTIDVYCGNESAVDALVNEILNSTLPGSTLVERHGRFLRFDLSSLDSSGGLGTLFRQLQSLKENGLFCLENYSISQCSLEQVFISLVNASSRIGEES